LGGSAHKVLVVEVTNTTAAPVDLHVVASVGKHGEKEPIAARDVRKVGPGEQRTIRLPFVISAPAWGSYTVQGTVYGAGAPSNFTTTTSNDPWLLWFLLPVLLLAVAEYLRWRERRQRRREAANEAARAAAAAAAIESSPEVPVPYEERYAVASYDPSSNGAAAQTESTTSEMGAGAVR
jgi:hypothetical protein